MSIGIAILAAAIIAAAPAAPSGDEGALLQAGQQFTAAVAANDMHAIMGLTTEDWLIIDADGHMIPRAAFLNVIQSGALKHSAMSLSDERVRVYGDAAIVTAHAKSAGTYAGAAFSTDEVSTDFWVRTKDGWRCALTQLTARKP